MTIKPGIMMPSPAWRFAAELRNRSFDTEIFRQNIVSVEVDYATRDIIVRLRDTIDGSVMNCVKELYDPITEHECLHVETLTPRDEIAYVERFKKINILSHKVRRDYAESGALEHVLMIKYGVHEVLYLVEDFPKVLPLDIPK